VQRDCTVDVQRRLRGGGGDGGATGAESRVSYLEMYMSKKPDKVCVLPCGVSAGFGRLGHAPRGLQPSYMNWTYSTAQHVHVLGVAL
jgi:hypothetical protein